MNEDFTDLLLLLSEEGVQFVVVGAQALAAHGVPRATADLDVLVRPDVNNAPRVCAALRAFGAPLAAHGVRETDFSAPSLVYQIGLPPRRIDLITSIDGVAFEDAWGGRVERMIGGVPVPFIGLREFCRNKAASGRTKDLLDLELLREAGVPVDAYLSDMDND